MEEFLSKLYSYENFGLYLIISIIILVILFIVVLFFGKKDQKHREIEATKKLMQIQDEENAFKENTIAEQVEVNKEQEKLENDTIVVPTIDDVPVINSENIEMNVPSNEVPASLEPAVEEVPVVNEPITETPTPLVEETPINIPVIEEKQEEPILQKVEEMPIMFNDEVAPVKREDVKINIPEVKEESSVPTFDFEEIIKSVEEVKEDPMVNLDVPKYQEEKKEEPVIEDVTVNKGPEIFSSVYVPEKEKSVPTSEELEFELPTLKKDVKKEEPKEIDIPVLRDYNLDNIAGETYNINK